MNQSSDLIELSELAAVCARDLGDPIAQAESMVLETLGGEAPRSKSTRLNSSHT